MRTGSSVRGSTSRVAVICDPPTATTRPIELSMREVLWDARAISRRRVCQSISISTVEGFHFVIEIGALAPAGKIAPIDCDRLDDGEDLGSGREAQCLARTSGHSRQQPLAAEAELYLERGVLGRNQPFDLSRQHVERADPGGASDRKDHIARADPHPQ